MFALHSAFIWRCRNVICMQALVNIFNAVCIQRNIEATLAVASDTRWSLCENNCTYLWTHYICA
ncbi:hypothetical protein Egran_00429 [Elaphomyces granulatus]|uniref:Uncharacterized protein n=1 Tax=Elaphomyces granulatus TaxID=519963 RepID=A0A232M5W7_9EURO|nr:hypothetical protein Egran_00429 [Elaphomyces granulatus]